MYGYLIIIPTQAYLQTRLLQMMCKVLTEEIFPESLSSQLQAGDGNVDALDPDFEIPQSWKFSMGSNYSFDIADWVKDVNFEFDYSYSRVRYGLVWKDLRRNSSSFENNLPTAVGPDGRDLYNTNPSENDNTNFDPRRGYDMLLTNTDKGYSHTAFLALSKYFKMDLILEALTVGRKYVKYIQGPAQLLR